MPSLNEVRQQALQDLLDAERGLRTQAEEELRLLRDLLYSLARVLDGDRVEQIRRADPRAFRSWNAEQYDQFFAPLIARQQWSAVSHQKGTGWGNNDHGEEAKKIQRLEAEVKRLKQRLETSRLHNTDLVAQLQEANRARPKREHPEPQPPKKKQAAQAKAKKKPRRKAQTTQAKISAPNREEIIAALRKTRKQPPTIPARVEHLFSGSVIGRTRQIMALYLLAVAGINLRLELDYYIATVDGIKPRSGGVRKKLDALQEQGIVQADKLTLSATRTSLITMRLTDEGKRLAEQVFMQMPVESEWERLNRLHEGERFQGHTAAVLLFAMYARIQDYRVKVLPEVESPSPPDILIANNNERLFVEVELGRKERPAKWKHNAALNGGKVALVTGTANRREVLTADIKRMGLPGMATDLEYLLRKGRDPETEPLWIAEW